MNRIEIPAVTQMAGHRMSVETYREHKEGAAAALGSKPGHGDERRDAAGSTVNACASSTREGVTPMGRPVVGAAGASTVRKRLLHALLSAVSLPMSDLCNAQAGASR